MVGEIRNGIGGDAQEAGIGERYSYKYREITKIENNAVQGNAYDWGRFVDMFVTQVHNRSISAEEIVRDGESHRLSKDRKPQTR